MAFIMALKATKEINDTLIIKKRKKTVTLEELQSMVEGYIEVLPTALPGIVMAVNEEGKINGSAYNDLATGIISFDDIIFGNAVLISEDGEDLVPIPEERFKEVLSSVCKGKKNTA